MDSLGEFFIYFTYCIKIYDIYINIYIIDFNVTRLVTMLNILAKILSASRI